MTQNSNNARTGVIEYFVAHRTAANLLLLLMVVAGVYAGLHMRTQFFPDVVIDKVSVNVKWSGVAPKEVDSAIVARLEPKLRAVEGVKSLTTIAREGSAALTLEFQPSWDMAAALDDVRAALDEVTGLPEDADDAVVRRARWRDRVSDVVISGAVPVAQLNRYADELISGLFRAGVTRTTIQGISDPIIRIDVSPQALERHKLTLPAIAAAITAETGTQPVGEIDGGAARIRTSAKQTSVATVGAIAIRSLPNGTKLRLHDVATVREEGLDRQVAFYKDGAPAVLVRVDRDAKGDAIKLQKVIERVIARIQPSLPKGVHIMLAHPRAQAISDRLDILIRNGIGGLVIVVLLLFLFLSARTAIWVAAGIPTAMAATIALMYVSGLSLNMISLFALIICLGIVVDDAIVVGEHADHLARQGLRPVDAAGQAARRMSAPVFAASITTVIAFAGLMMVGGRFGRLISDLPITVGVVILASLLESFLILPAHMRHALAAKNPNAWYDTPNRVFNRGFAQFRGVAFRPFVRWVVRLRYPVLACALLLLAVSAAALIEGTVRWRFFSAPERSTIRANIAMLPGAARSDTKAMVMELDRALKIVDARYAKRHGHAPVKLALAKLGGTTGRGLRSAALKDTDLLGGYDIELIDPDQRSYSAFEFIREWRKEIRRHPMLETLALRGERSGPGGDAIHIRFSGDDETVLKAAAEAVKASLARFPAVIGLEDDLPYDKPELVVTLTPKGEALGFTTASVARALRQRLDGIEAAKIVRGNREVTIRVQLADAVVGPSYLHNAKLPLPNGNFIPLAEIVTITQENGFSAIRRGGR